MTGYLFENDGLEADFWFFHKKRDREKNQK